MRIIDLELENQELKQKASLYEGKERVRDKISLINKNEIQIKKKIAVGGFGSVFKAIYNNMECVAKEFDIEYYDPQNPEQNKGNSYLQEIINCAVLKYDHPNIQSLLACGLDYRDLQDDSHKKAFLVFPYINGGDLFQFVKQKKFENYLKQNFQDQKSQQRAILEFFLQISDGIEFLHSQNLFHCDLKPDNIMVQISPDQKSIRPIIIDYGISYFKNTKTMEVAI